MNVLHVIDSTRLGRGRLVLGLALLVCGACSRRHAQPSSLQPAPSQERAQVAVPPSVQPLPPPPSNVQAQLQQPTQTVSSAVLAAPSQPVQESAEKEEEKPRDFAAELQAMMAQASACLESRVAGAGPTGTELAVTAHVLPSGAVRHGEAGGSGLKPQELACIKQQLEGLHFAPPIENAPMSVHAALKLEFTLTRGTPIEESAKHAGDPSKPWMPTADGRTPGVVPPADPGVVPTEDPGIVPAGNPGVVPAEDKGTLPTPDPPAEVLAPPPPLPPE